MVYLFAEISTLRVSIIRGVGSPLLRFIPSSTTVVSEALSVKHNRRFRNSYSSGQRDAADTEEQVI